ncbi:unnamed protein product [Closterium sp. NIES-53]
MTLALLWMSRGVGDGVDEELAIGAGAVVAASTDVDAVVAVVFADVGVVGVGRPIQFDTWLDDLQLYLLSDSKDSVSLFNLAPGATTAPPTTADVRLAHIACYSSPAIAALGRLLLPYLFPELSAFAMVEDLVSHLRASDARYYVTDHFLSLDPTSLTVDLLEEQLLAGETSAVAVGAAHGTPRTPFFEGTSELLLLVQSAAAARARVARVVEGAAGVVVGAAVEIVEAVEVVAVVGLVAGEGALAAAVEAAVGVAAMAVVELVAVGPELGMETCGRLHTQHYCFSRLDDAWHAEFGDEVERPRWADLLRSGVAIFDLDFDVILSAMYALSVSAEGDCYRCVPPDPGIAAAALGASEFGTLPGTAPAEALHTFMLDSGASRCFFCDSTTLTPLSAPVPFRQVEPSGGPVVARSSTVILRPAVPSGSLSGLHLPSFSMNLVSTAALQDAMVTTTTPRGVRVRSGSTPLLVSPPVAPDPSVEPLPGSPLPPPLLEVLVPGVLELPRLVVLGALELETLQSQELLEKEALALVVLELEALELEALAREALELELVLGVPSSTALSPPLLCPLPDQSQPSLQPASPLPAPSPYTEQTGGLTERREPASCPASPVCTARRVPRPRPPLVPSTHTITFRPSSVPLRVLLPATPESSLPAVPEPESNLTRAARPTVSRLLATAVIDPSFESTAASAHVVELLVFAAACRLDYTTALVVESASASPLSIDGECALGLDVLEDRQDNFECLAAAVPRFASMLLTAEGDPDDPHIPSPRSYAEVITGLYSSQWQATMDAKMASRKSIGTYVDEVPPPGANIVDGMWIFRVKRPPGSPPAFKSHKEIWLCRSPGFTRSFPAGTQWSLRQPVYGLRQVPHEWHDTLRTTLAALGFAPSTVDQSLFLCTYTSLPPFYFLVYIDDLVFATGDTEALTLITRDRARRTITLTQSHMVHLILQRFDFKFSSPQPTPLSTSHSLATPPLNESVEPSGPYPELVGCLMYLMTCKRPNLAYPLSLLARYVAPATTAATATTAAAATAATATAATAATTTATAIAATTAPALLGVGKFVNITVDAAKWLGEAKPGWQVSPSWTSSLVSNKFDTWLDDLQLYLLSDSKDTVSLFYLASGAATAPPATADSATCSQTAHALYVAVVARYSSPATTALGRLLLPYLFPELSAFAIVEDLVSNLRTCDARYRAAATAEFLDRNLPLMIITLYFIVTRLPDSLRSVKPHFISLDPTSLTVDLLKEHLIAAETSAVAVGAARGTSRTPFVEGCSPSTFAPSYASAAAAADVLGAEDVGSASASAKCRRGKGKGSMGGGGGSRSGGGGSSGGSGGSRGGGSGGSGGGSGGAGEA